MTARKDVGYECYWWLGEHLVASVMEDSGIHKEGNTGLWKGTNIIGAIWPNSHTLKLYVCNNLRWHRTFTGKVVLMFPVSFLHYRRTRIENPWIFVLQSCRRDQLQLPVFAEYPFFPWQQHRTTMMMMMQVMKVESERKVRLNPFINMVSVAVWTSGELKLTGRLLSQCNIRW